jgi:hypothetical protein
MRGNLFNKVISPAKSLANLGKDRLHVLALGLGQVSVTDKPAAANCDWPAARCLNFCDERGNVFWSHVLHGGSSTVVRLP